MPKISLFTPNSGKGISVGMSAQERINCYLEPGQDKTSLAVIGLPGDVSAATVSATGGNFVPCGVYSRAQGYASRPCMVSVNGQAIFTDFAGATTQFTNVWGVGVSITHRNWLADITGGYDNTYIAHADVAGFWYRSPTTSGRITSGPLASLALATIAQLQNRLIGAGRGARQFYWSNLADITTWSSLSTATVAAESGDIKALRAYKNLLIIFCANAVEFWQPTPDPNNPFEPVQGASIRVGALNPESVRVYKDAIYFLGSVFGDAEGSSRTQFAAYRLSGTQIERLSDSNIERQWAAAWQTVTIPAFPRIVGLYSWNGHDFLEIGNLDTPRVNFLFDATTGAWSTRQYNASETVPPYLILNVSVDSAQGEVPYDATQSSVVAVSFPGSTVINVRRFDESSFTWGSGAYSIAYQITTPHYWDSAMGNRVGVPRVRLDMDRPSSPQPITLQTSRDRGGSYGAPQATTYSASGQAEWRRLGMARDWVFRISQTGGLFRCLGAWADFEKAGS